jgi:hypothetical protein
MYSRLTSYYCSTSHTNYVIGDFILTEDTGSEESIRKGTAVIYRLDGFYYAYEDPDIMAVYEREKSKRKRKKNNKKREKKTQVFQLLQRPALRAYVTPFGMMKSEVLQQAKKEWLHSIPLWVFRPSLLGIHSLVEVREYKHNASSSEVDLASILATKIRCAVTVSSSSEQAMKSNHHFICRWTIGPDWSRPYHVLSPMLGPPAVTTAGPSDSFAWIEVYIDGFGPIAKSRGLGGWTVVYLCISNISRAHKHIREHVKTIMIIPPDTDLNMALEPLRNDLKLLESKDGFKYQGLTIRGQISFIIADHVRLNILLYLYKHKHFNINHQRIYMLVTVLYNEGTYLTNALYCCAFVVTV